MNARTPGKLLLLDTASLYFRAFYGVPESVRAPDGTPVNAVRGLLDFIARLVRDHSPTELVACMDADWRPRWRVDLIPSYKAHRVAAGEEDGEAGEAGETGGGAEDVPDTLSPQVPVIEAVLDAVGIARLGVAGYEADDVIGTLAARAATPVAIVTGDRDLFQLVDDAREVRVLFPRKGVGDPEVIDEEAILVRYGVRADQYADFAALRGDPSDGLPGVKGIGDKSAAELITRYGDLAGVRAAADEPLSKLTPARRRNIKEAASYLEVAPKVVAVARDVPLPDFDARLPAGPADPDGLLALAGRWGLGGSLDRLLESLAVAAG
ncbi:5'-3' exonuclease H3TH domain-containing protein [Streptomyces sp. HPF1205]|uniref:5'-3' exonuclease n=1 Tax=Streptomyces sp. HPF1205 TaxID=2873262 RepID=UPI001CEDA901|nr:5'-3' exonuclease H3TH domain-containing protein [Streptomyces sp. HPF1205]